MWEEIRSVLASKLGPLLHSSALLNPAHGDVRHLPSLLTITCNFVSLLTVSSAHTKTKKNEICKLVLSSADLSSAQACSRAENKQKKRAQKSSSRLCTDCVSSPPIASPGGSNVITPISRGHTSTRGVTSSYCPGRRVEPSLTGPLGGYPGPVSSAFWTYGLVSLWPDTGQLLLFHDSICGNVLGHDLCVDGRATFEEGPSSRFCQCNGEIIQTYLSVMHLLHLLYAPFALGIPPNVDQAMYM